MEQIPKIDVYSSSTFTLVAVLEYEIMRMRKHLM